jgi:hypothetical protein
MLGTKGIQTDLTTVSVQRTMSLKGCTDRSSSADLDEEWDELGLEGEGLQQRVPTVNACRQTTPQSKVSQRRVKSQSRLQCVKLEGEGLEQRLPTVHACGQENATIESQSKVRQRRVKSQSKVSARRSKVKGSSNEYQPSTPVIENARVKSQSHVSQRGVKNQCVERLHAQCTP